MQIKYVDELVFAQYLKKNENQWAKTFTSTSNKVYWNENLLKLYAELHK